MVDTWQNIAENPIPAWLQGRGFGTAGATLVIATASGTRTIQPQFWVICDEHGRIFARSPEDFAAIFEPAE